MRSHGFDNGTADQSAAADTIPQVCPACRSTSISTTARNPDENAYWRCAVCGEVWNASRRTAPSTNRGRTW